MEYMIRFPTDGLLSKWGFGDGDMLDDLLFDWLDDTGRSIPERNGHRGTWEHRVLVRLVREFVVPAIDQPIEVYEIGTAHNPIRASSVNGEPWDVYTTDTEGVLTPEWVDVPLSEVLRVAAEEVS